MFLTGKNLGEIEDDVFITKILEEDTGDSGIIAAFEKFTSELEKVYWVTMFCNLMFYFAQCGLLLARQNCRCFN